MRPLEDFSGSLAQSVYASMREASLSMFFRPGDILRKPKICTQSGVSRTPVFEAVTRLAVEHLVRTVPQSSTYVARFSLAEIREGAFLPEALELVTVEKLAQTITDDGVGQLRRNLSLQKNPLEVYDFDSFYQTHAAMHAPILSFGGHTRAAALADTSWIHCRAPSYLCRHRGPQSCCGACRNPLAFGATCGLSRTLGAGAPRSV